MIALVIFIGLLVVAAVFVAILVVMFVVAVVRYRKGKLTKEELDASSRKVKNTLRKKYYAWRNSPTWYDRTFGYR